MMLLDTNVLICAADEKAQHCRWARRMIADGVSGDGAAVNAVISLNRLVAPNSAVLYSPR
jgi:hypothetical protein